MWVPNTRTSGLYQNFRLDGSGMNYDLPGSDRKRFDGWRREGDNPTHPCLNTDSLPQVSHHLHCPPSHLIFCHFLTISPQGAQSNCERTQANCYEGAVQAEECQVSPPGRGARFPGKQFLVSPPPGGARFQPPAFEILLTPPGCPTSIHLYLPLNSQKTFLKNY